MGLSRCILFLSATLATASACFFELPELRTEPLEGGPGIIPDGPPSPDVTSTLDAGTTCDAWLCEDFERGPSPRLTELAEAGSATIAAAGAGFMSEHALLASTDRNPGSERTFAYVRTNDDAGLYDHAHVSYSLIWDDATLATGFTFTAQISHGGKWQLGLLLYPDGRLVLVERAPDPDGGALTYVERATLPVLPRKTWKRFDLDLRPPATDGGAGSITIAVDGIVSVDAVALTEPSALDGPRRFAFGLTSAQGPTGAWRLRLDDLRIALE